MIDFNRTPKEKLIGKKFYLDNSDDEFFLAEESNGEQWLINLYDGKMYKVIDVINHFYDFRFFADEEEEDEDFIGCYIIS